MRSVIIIAAGLLFLAGKGSCQSIVSEEGKPQTLTCDVVGQSFQDLKWLGQKLTNDTTYTLVSTCPENGQCSDSFQEFSSKIEQITGGYRSTLTIKNVVKSGWREWLCSRDDSKIKEYSLDVYHIIGPANCDIPVLTNSNTGLLLTCWTEKTYPQADCKLYLIRNNVEDKTITSSIVYHHTETNGYFRSECSTILPVSDLKPGEYSSKAWIYPKVADGIDHGVWTNVTENISLIMPEANISDSCPDGSHVSDGYIKAGTSATCTCTLQNEGNPPGQPVWLSSSGKEVETTSKDDQSTILHVEEPGAVNETYSCLAKSALGQQDPSLQFCPKFTYGPVHPSIQGLDNKTISLCTSTNPEVTVHCELDADNVHPNPAFDLLLNDTIYGKSEPQAIQPSGKYRATFTFPIDVPGKLSVKCRAVNSKFSDIFSDAELIIEVAAPPQSSPVIRINNGQPLKEGETVTYAEGDSIDINCQAIGGYPLTSNISLMCLDSHFQEGTSISTSLEVNRTINGLKCVCSAQHMTGCYQLIKSFTLNILFSPKVTMFTVNDQSGQVEIDEGQESIMKCFADGNPQLRITIKKSSSSNLVAQANNTDYLLYKNENTQCEDIGAYLCEAVNLVGQMQGRLELFVRCPIALRNETSNGSYINTNSDTKTVNVVVNVQGYPAANDFKLFIKDGQIVSSKSYQASSNSNTVFLLLDVDPDKRETYILHAGNGFGEPLKYEFTVGPNTTSGYGASDDNNLIIILPVSLGVGVTIIIIAVILCKCRRKSCCNWCSSDHGESNRCRSDDRELNLCSSDHGESSSKSENVYDSI